MNKPFGIGIPTFNRWDLLRASIEKYVVDFPNVEIHILDNGQQNIPYFDSNQNICVHEMDKNLGVAGGWNYLIHKIFENNDYALILNDDIYLGKTASQINALIDKNNFSLMVTSLDWCAYIMPKNTWNIVGKFDENFYPAYCEDCDYHLRMIKKGLTLSKSSYLIPETYQASMTMAKNPELFYKANHKNKQYFKDKWGKYPEEILPD